MSFILLSLEVLSYEIHLSDTNSNYYNHFKNAHHGLSERTISGQVGMLLLEILLLLDIP